MDDKAGKKSSLFVGHFGKPGNIPPPGDPITVTSMTVDVDRISFFAGNPRRTPNEKYGEIKDSIRESGLDNPLPISRRPDDPVGHYIIYKGGNTRLRALKELWKETKDQRFLKVRCEFHPFVSDTDALIAHLRENDLRGGMTFIDRALAVQDAKAKLEGELGETLSLRKLEAAFKQRGFPISNGTISQLEYAAKVNAYIPSALKSGIGEPQIRKLRKLEKATFEVWRFHGNPNGIEQQFREQVFAPALSSTDSESWAYESAETMVKGRLLAVLPQGTDTDAVLGSFRRALEGKELKVPEPVPVPQEVLGVQAPGSASSGSTPLPIPAPQEVIPVESSPGTAPAYAPLDQYDLLGSSTAPNIPIPGMTVSGQGAGAMGERPADTPRAAVQTARQLADSGISIESGGGMLGDDGVDDSDAFIEDWMPYAPQKEVVIAGSGRWLDQIRALRERNYELAAKLADGYVPKGRHSITKLDVGYGFVLNDVFNIDYLVNMEERLRGEAADQYSSDEKTDADEALCHTATLWWFLAEISAMFHDEFVPWISCPPELLAQHTPEDSYLHDLELLGQIHRMPPAGMRLRTWWSKLPDTQLEWVFELVRNTKGVLEILNDHQKETGGAGPWEITT